MGAGDPFVMLHGWGANRNTFKNLANHLKERYKVYILDLPGFGESEIGLPFNLFEVSDILKHFCDYLHITNPIILGHSYGSRIAIIYASKYKVKKLILVSAAGLKEKLRFDKRLKVKIYKFLHKYHINVKMGSKDFLDADNVKRRMLIDAVNTDLSKEMNLIDGIDVLLIYGKDDKTTSVEIGRKIEEKIKNSALVIIDDASHFPYLQQPTIFNLILDSFLVGE